MFAVYCALSGANPYCLQNAPDTACVQVFGFVNVQLFNQLLLRRECCSFSNGEYVKTGLAELENWILAAGDGWVGQSWEELRFIRQVCECLKLGFAK